MKIKEKQHFERHKYKIKMKEEIDSVFLIWIFMLSICFNVHIEQTFAFF